MRWWLALALTACSYSPSSLGGDDTPPGPDGPAVYVLPEPVLIPGGGVQDGPIRAGINVTVIDVESNLPVSGAAIAIGAFTGTTAASGVVVLDDAALVGKQTVLATAAGYRAEQWVGVDGANVTIPLAPLKLPTGSASGLITNFASLPISGASNHSRVGFVLFSQDDRASVASNSIQTSGLGNFCSDSVCDYVVQSRVGPVSLMASIYDYDDNGTQTDNDDDARLIGWAFRSGVSIADGADTPSQNLTIVATTNAMTVDLGTAPPGLIPSFAFPGIELSPTEWIPLFDFSGDSLVVPTLSAIPTATSYRLTAFARSNDRLLSSIATRRGAMSPALAVGSWLPPPQNVMATTTATTFDAVTGAAIHSVVYRDDGVGADLVEIMTFDSTASVTVPAGISPPVGATVTVQAIRTTLDVTHFGFDADADKIDDRASVRTTAN